MIWNLTDIEREIRKLKRRIAALEGSSGGGGGDSIYTDDGLLTGPRVVGLDGSSLSFEDHGTSLFFIDPLNQTISLRADADGDTYSSLNLQGQIVGGIIFTLGSFDNSDGSFVTIIGDGALSTITHTADLHTFNGVRFDVSVTDNSASGQINLQSATGDEVYFRMIVQESGNDPVSIVGNGITETITHTASIHQFNIDASQFVLTDTGSGEDWISINSHPGTGSMRFYAPNTAGTGYSELFIINADDSTQRVRSRSEDGSGVASEIDVRPAIITLTAERNIVNGRLQQKQGAAVTIDNVTSQVVLGTDGNVFEVLVDSNNELEGISDLNWELGSMVTLLFGASSVDIIHNQSNSGNKIGIVLAKGSTLTTASGDMLHVIYTSIGGVLKWREIYPSV